MLERLIDFILGMVQMFQFWYVVNEYENGVILRFGKFNRVILPGLHFLLPFWIDVVLVDNVVTTTTNLGPQSLMTMDGKQVVISTIITWQICDIKKILLEVESSDQVLADVTYGTVGEIVNCTNWASVQSPDFAKQIGRKSRSRAKSLGIHISELYLSDKTSCRSLRLWQEQT